MSVIVTRYHTDIEIKFLRCLFFFPVLIIPQFVFDIFVYRLQRTETALPVRGCAAHGRSAIGLLGNMSLISHPSWSCILLDILSDIFLLQSILVIFLLLYPWSHVNIFPPLVINFEFFHLGHTSILSTVSRMICPLNRVLNDAYFSRILQSYLRCIVFFKSHAQLTLHITSSTHVWNHIAHISFNHIFNVPSNHIFDMSAAAAGEPSSSVNTAHGRSPNGIGSEESGRRMGRAQVQGDGVSWWGRKGPSFTGTVSGWVQAV